MGAHGQALEVVMKAAMDWLIILAIAGGVILVSTVAGLVPIVLLKGYLALLGAIVLIGAAVRMAPEVIDRRGRRGKDGRREDGPPGAMEEPAVADAEGKAVTALRPAGFVEIAGKRYAARSELGYIDAGRPVRVVRWEAGTAMVRERGS